MLDDDVKASLTEHSKGGHDIKSQGITKASRLLCRAYSRTKSKPATSDDSTTSIQGSTLGLKGLLHNVFSHSLPLSALLPVLYDLIQAVDLPVLAGEQSLPSLVSTHLLPLISHDTNPLELVADILAVANLTLTTHGHVALFVETLEGAEKRCGVKGVNTVLLTTLRAYQRLTAGKEDVVVLFTVAVIMDERMEANDAFCWW